MGKKLRFFVLTIFMLCGFGNLLGDEKPMPPRKVVDIPNGEFLKYSISEGGEEIQEFRMITRFEENNRARAYLNLHFVDDKSPVPATIKDYNSYALIDLKNSSMVEYLMDQYDYRVKQLNEEGPFSQKVIIDGDRLTRHVQSWDGNEVKEEKSVVEGIDSSYPTWTVEAFALWGGRILDWNDGGVIMTVVPVRKNPFKSYLVVLGQEVIETPAGKFETTKLRFRLSNLFLDLLMRVFTDNLYLWVENGPRRRIIQMTSPEKHTWKLTEAKIVDGM